MVHKIWQKFYKSAVFPQNKALLFSKIVSFGVGKERRVLAKKEIIFATYSRSHCSILPTRLEQ